MGRLWQVGRADRGALTPSGGPPYTRITNLQQQENFTYDETGNWLGYQSMSPALVQTRAHNKANETTSITNPSGVAQPGYDEAGNMTAFPAPSNWTTGYAGKWDAWNRLVEVKQGSAVIGSYAYDARTRRIKKSTATETRDYYYDNQWRVIEERVSGSIEAQYGWSPFDRWNLIRRQRSVSGTLDETLYVLRDYLDPLAIVNDSGTVVERYGYDAFGPVRIMNADFSARISSAYDWTFLFHGEFIDSESGLYNYGYRYYHPQLGRWLSRDPIGEEGGINLFMFVGNDPGNEGDKYGLGTWTFNSREDGQLTEVYYTLDDEEKKCCDSATVDRYYDGSKLGVYTLDHSKDSQEFGPGGGSWEPETGRAYAEPDSPEGGGVFIPLVGTWRFPDSQRFKWVAKCTSGPNKGKQLSEKYGNWNTEGHWDGEPQHGKFDKISDRRPSPHILLMAL